MEDIDNIECIQAEEDDGFSDDSLFSITSWGADLTFREIITMYEEDELVKPELQRRYVWDKLEASRFIESLLMGLPVPSIFFATSGSQKLIVDGYQRIMTVYDYVRGIFSADRKVFKLSNSEKINERWRNKAYSELNIDDQRRIKTTTIHAIIFDQKKPENDNASMYQIFERINTSGRSLNPQEIRNCINQGSFNTMLFKLNKDKIWRQLFGTVEEDNRMRDAEFILRFFAMKDNMVQKSELDRISLKKTLNDYMGKYKNASPENIKKWQTEFASTMLVIYDTIGVNAFRNYSSGKFSTRFHPAIFDALSVACFQIMQCGIKVKPVSEKKHIALLKDTTFQNAISTRTTDIENIKLRISIAKELFA